jgi:hypothetical protein
MTCPSKGIDRRQSARQGGQHALRDSFRHRSHGQRCHRGCYAVSLACEICAAPRAIRWYSHRVVCGRFGSGCNRYRYGLGVPGLATAVLPPVIGLCFAFFAVDRIRTGLATAPLALLIGVNTVRVIGVSFLLLYSAHRLPAPFAPVAGWGDIFVGATARLVAWLALPRREHSRTLIFVWNTIGILDFAAAIALGATSTPGPVPLFAGPPDSSLITSLPWIIIPCFVVPSLESLHVVIFWRLREVRHGRKPSSYVRATA